MSKTPHAVKKEYLCDSCQAWMGFAGCFLKNIHQGRNTKEYSCRMYKSKDDKQ